MKYIFSWKNKREEGDNFKEVVASAQSVLLGLLGLLLLAALLSGALFHFTDFLIQEGPEDAA